MLTGSLLHAAQACVHMSGLERLLLLHVVVVAVVVVAVVFCRSLWSQDGTSVRQAIRASITQEFADNGQNKRAKRHAGPLKNSVSLAILEKGLRN